MESKGNDKAIKVLDKSNFEETIKTGVTLVDFWAEWCGPCVQQMPVVQQLAEEISSDTVTIAKVDVDAHQDIAAKYEISSIPALFIFKDGEIVKRLVGVQSLEVLKKAIDEA